MGAIKGISTAADFRNDFNAVGFEGVLLC